jgi:hypothetical protein
MLLGKSFRRNMTYPNLLRFLFTDDNLCDLLGSLRAILLARIPANHTNNPTRISKLANSKFQPMRMVPIVSISYAPSAYFPIGVNFIIFIGVFRLLATCNRHGSAHGGCDRSIAGFEGDVFLQ